MIKRFFHQFVFGNFFIGLCATAMVYATFILNHIPFHLTHFTILLTCSTFLLYNFHTYSFQIDYSGLKEFYNSVNSLVVSGQEIIIFIAVIILSIVELLMLSEKVLLWSTLLVFLSLLYSIPILGIRKKYRIRESVFVKIPLLALVWALATVVIPLAEQNIYLESAFVLQQVGSGFLFVFALCIPFEIRDLESDKSDHVKTLPSVFGEKETKKLGSIFILMEIVLHHFMELQSSYIIALDLSSVLALILIFARSPKSNGYFYQLFVDGTMLVRFLFLYFVYYFL